MQTYDEAHVNSYRQVKEARYALRRCQRERQSVCPTAQEASARASPQPRATPCPRRQWGSSTCPRSRSRGQPCKSRGGCRGEQLQCQRRRRPTTMVSRECIASWKVTHTHVRQHRGGDCNAVLVGAAHRRIARKAELRRGDVASHRDEACSDNASLDGGERDLEDSGEAHVHED